MKVVVLCVCFFLIVLCLYSVDAGRFGGGRFGGSRFSSSRYSSSRYSSFGYRSSRYSFGYRSSRYSSSRYRYRSPYRSYRSYFRLYSRRYSYRSRYSSMYRSVRVSAGSMGGLASNKQTLLLAGSVYISYRVRRRVFSSRGSLYTGVADEYAICAGMVRWDSLTKNAYYSILYDNIAWGSSSTSAATTAIPTSAELLLAGDGNATVESTDRADGTTTSPVGRFITYHYFLCPSNLFNNNYDGEDTYCCGPAGSQMCCSKEDFEEELGKTTRNTVGIIFAIAFAVAICCSPIYIFRSRIRNFLRCRKCRRTCSDCMHSSSNGNSGQAGANTARPDVSFHQVAKVEEEPHVMLSGIRDRRHSNSSSRSGSNPVASGQTPYPLYPPQVDSGVGAQPQYPLYPPANGNGAQMPPLPSRPPPAYEDLQH